ncbi:MAG: PA2778 family cysteine peptidase [Betaproteobacteria bacterium]|nr:PA2778 family cysteine peptidase [Betaproteobacteria bacterium]MDE2622257.1 PA2778 family cysteine peptidase [Betaproteobacteria bacterium]
MRGSSLTTALAALLMLVLAGCASVQPKAPDSALPAQLPSAVKLAGVPFFPQQEYQCGPAALATTLAYSGVAVTPRKLAPQVYTPALKGSLQLDLIGSARRHDRIPYRIAPTRTALFEELAAGNPVLVLQEVGPLFSTEWHYAVVVGYDRPTGDVTLQSGPKRALHMTWPDFDRSWHRGGRWGLVTLPPERMPASATEQDYLRQVAALEPVRPALARDAYHASLAHWPGSLGALMGLGNLAYARHDLELAASYFRQATTAHPDAGDAFNNLAQTELALGRKDEARAAIGKALALGGLHTAIYRKTKAEIDAAP